MSLFDRYPGRSPTHISLLDEKGKGWGRVQDNEFFGYHAGDIRGRAIVAGVSAAINAQPGVVTGTGTVAGVGRQFSHYPDTAAEMATAVGWGTWTAGYLFDEPSGAAAPIFGGKSSLISIGTTPTYGVTGMLPAAYDTALTFATNSKLIAASTSDGDINLTSDSIIAIVMRFNTTAGQQIISKANPTNPGWKLTSSAGNAGIQLIAADGSNNYISTTVNVNNGDWLVVLAAMDRGAATMNCAVYGQTHAGLYTVPTAVSIAGMLTLSTATPLTIGSQVNDSGGSAIMTVAAIYYGTGVGAASGAVANIGTAATNLFQYLSTIPSTGTVVGTATVAGVAAAAGSAIAATGVATGAFAGNAQVPGAIAATGVATGAFAGIGNGAGVIASAATATGALASSQIDAGALAATGVAAGAFAGIGNGAGSIAATGVATAALTSSQLGTGSIASSGVATAALTGSASSAAALAASGLSSGDLSASELFAGSIAALGTSSGDFSAPNTTAASIAAVATATGSFTGSGNTPVVSEAPQARAASFQRDLEFIDPRSTPWVGDPLTWERIEAERLAAIAKQEVIKAEIEQVVTSGSMGHTSIPAHDFGGSFILDPLRLRIDALEDANRALQAELATAHQHAASLAMLAQAANVRNQELKAMVQKKDTELTQLHADHRELVDAHVQYVMKTDKRLDKLEAVQHTQGVTVARLDGRTEAHGEMIGENKARMDALNEHDNVMATEQAQRDAAAEAKVNAAKTDAVMQALARDILPLLPACGRFDVVREQRGQYYVFNESETRVLGGPYTTQQAAEERLRQIDYFKANKKDFS